LFGSLAVLTQPEAQQTSEPGQPVEAQVSFGAVQTPSKHESPGGQIVPHPPQLFGSKLMLAVQPSACASFVPPSPATHRSVLGSHVVPLGQAWFSHDGPFGRPSSP